MAGIPNATHYAIFPLLLWSLIEMTKNPRWLGWRDWFFVVLDKQEYAVSLACDATKTTELYQIVAMLSAMPEIIQRYL